MNERNALDLVIEEKQLFTDHIQWAEKIHSILDIEDRATAVTVLKTSMRAMQAKEYVKN